MVVVVSRARALCGLVLAVGLLWSTAASATTVPITNGSTFTSDSGLVDYTILNNVGFGATATLPAGANGFDMVPDLSLFVFSAGPPLDTITGEFTFLAEGVDFGAITSVIDELIFSIGGSFNVTGGTGLAEVLASMDVTSVNGTPTGQPPVGTPTISKNMLPLILNPGDTWSHDADWLASEFGLAAGIDITGVQVDITVNLGAFGIGTTTLTEAMVITETSLVPTIPTAPEPSAVGMLGMGLVAFLGVARRRIRG